MNAPFRPIKDTIGFDHFNKADIRIGSIVEATPVPKTTKLLQLQVDFGPEIGRKQVISGIAEHFSPEYLIGTNHPFVLNLEAREIRGLVSEGMILLTERPHGQLYSIGSQPVEPGSIVN
jgi:methionyl-tRNA synthetase